MKTAIIILILASVVGPAYGQEKFACSTSETFGNRIIKKGDSERRVIEAEPDRTVQLETRQGGAAGYRHDFYKQGRTVQVYVQAGVVTRVCRIRD